MHRRLRVIILKELFYNVFELQEAYQVDRRTAAYIHALNRQAEAIVAQGTHDYFSETF
ncbi:hypothetical protein [Legionella parisiensis]|uniref:hypothetical protein n=1 Tax=Legionella parisiensis TaxID=45071 RepID=UPI0012E331C2|nr:hypothetical protein [Legionella parisiensis]